MSSSQMAILNKLIKEFFFAYYLLIAVICSLIGVAFTFSFSKAETICGNLIPVVGATLGFLYFVQKQKIDETTLFEKLFTAFNQRYSKLNEDLRAIRDGSQADAMIIRRVLDDYFNLCAEEYHFYNDGRIPASIWKSWCLGMLYYLNPNLSANPIAEYFHLEVCSDSHYGLTLAAIQRGAA